MSLQAAREIGGTRMKEGGKKKKRRRKKKGAVWEERNI